MLMFGGCTRLYEVVWQVKIDEDYSSLAVPISFIFGKLDSSCILAYATCCYWCNAIGFHRKEWKLLDIIESNSDWNTGNW